MKRLFRILSIMSAALVLYLMIGMVLPDGTQFQRSIVINATPQNVWPFISNLKKYSQWSYMHTLDQGAQFEFVGPEQGEGAIMHWTSKHPDVRYGSQKILEVKKFESVKSILALGGLGKAFHKLSMQQEAGGTRVTWAFEMDFGYNLPTRYKHSISGLGLEEQYEMGLQNLKALAEQ